MNQVTITALDVRGPQTNTQIGVSKIRPFIYVIYTNYSCVSALYIILGQHASGQKNYTTFAKSCKNAQHSLGRISYSLTLVTLNQNP